MADTQYNPLGQENAPASWTLPPRLQILLKQCRASYDGTSSAGSYVPTVRIVTDSGHVEGEYPCGTTLAAGASADVTWFPGVAPSASTTVVEWFIARRTTSLTMLASNTDTIPWSDLHSSNTGLFSLATNTHTNDAVQVSQAGTVLMQSWALASALEPNFVMQILNNSSSGVSTDTNTPYNQYNTLGLPSVSTPTFGPTDISINVTDVVPFQLFAEYTNYDSSNRAMSSAQLWGLWWSNPTLSPF